MANPTPKDFDAIYENGTFRPVGQFLPTIPDGTRVKITVETSSDSPTGDVVELAASVYDGLTTQEIVEIEEIATDRSSFFSP